MIKKIINIIQSIIRKFFQLITIFLMVSVYFTIIPLTLLVSKVFKKNLLPVFSNTSSYWIKRKEPPVSLEDLRKQF